MLTCNLFRKNTAIVCLLSLQPNPAIDLAFIEYSNTACNDWSLPIKCALDVSFYTYHPRMPLTLGYFSDKVTDISKYKMWWFLRLNANPTIKIIWFRCHFFPLLSLQQPPSLFLLSLLFCAVVGLTSALDPWPLTLRHLTSHHSGGKPN